MEETLKKKKSKPSFSDAPADRLQLGRDDNVNTVLIIKANRNTKVSEMALRDMMP